MGSQTNDKFSVYYNVDTNKLIPDGSQYRSCPIISSVSELAEGNCCIIDMAVCCTLRVSDQPFAPDYLILIDDTFSKTKINK